MVSVVIEDTPFYAEMGGQVGDCGIISSGSSVLEVKDTQKLGGGQFVCDCLVVSGGFSVGDRVTAAVDAPASSASKPFS